jgi:DNA-binding response OmpR family regulator
MKILIIEDEKELSQSICEYLSGEQFTCEQAFDYDTAIEKIALYDYACIVLDIMLPGGSGMDILGLLKKENKLEGVLIVSAKNSIDDKVHGLKAGADDYLTKPFHLSELSARVAAIIRRKNFEGRPIVEFGALEVSLNQKEVKVLGKKIDLTRKEYELLLYFLANREKVINKNAIAIHLWGDDMDVSGNYDFIYTHIKNLRKKLLHAGAEDYIKSIYGTGYKFTET